MDQCKTDSNCNHPRVPGKGDIVITLHQENTDGNRYEKTDKCGNPEIKSDRKTKNHYMTEVGDHDYQYRIFQLSLLSSLI